MNELLAANPHLIVGLVSCLKAAYEVKTATVSAIQLQDCMP
jgi:hypothetical protein